MATIQYFYRFHKKVLFKAILERSWRMILAHFRFFFAHFRIPDAFPLTSYENGGKVAVEG
jgi:hypothetical protein